MAGARGSFGAIRGPTRPAEPSLAVGVALGVLAHLLAAAAGGGAGRAGQPGGHPQRSAPGSTVLVTGAVLVVVLGLQRLGRALAGAAGDGHRPGARPATPLPPAGTFWLLTGWAVALVRGGARPAYALAAPARRA